MSVVISKRTDELTPGSDLNACFGKRANYDNAAPGQRGDNECDSNALIAGRNEIGPESPGSDQTITPSDLMIGPFRAVVRLNLRRQRAARRRHDL